MTKIEIFKPGRFTPMKGGALEFSAADLQAAAAAYDPALFNSPVVIGHPKDTAPAYAWVKSVEFADGKLLADCDQVDPAFKDLVAKGRYKKVSPSFFKPDHPENPTPGKYYLRHVGFLGAAAPAVQGLKEASFAADDENVVTVEFAAYPGMVVWGWRSLADLFRGLREYLIARDGQEAADRAVPNYSIDQLASAAEAAETVINADAEVKKDAVQAQLLDTSFSASDQENDLTAEQLAAQKADLDKREKELEGREANFAASETARRATEDAALVDGLVAEGKVLPAERAGILAFMATLNPEGTVEFAASEGSEATKTPSREFFRETLARRPKLVDFKERSAAADDATVDFASPTSIAEAAGNYQAEQQKRGVYVDAATAVSHVTKGASR